MVIQTSFLLSKWDFAKLEFSGFEVTENVSTQLNRGFEQLPWAAAQRMSDRPWTHPRTCQTQTWGSGCSAVKLVTLDRDRYHEFIILIWVRISITHTAVSLRILVCAKTEEVLVSQRARGGAGTTDVTDTARKPGRGRTQYPKGPPAITNPVTLRKLCLPSPSVLVACRRY